MPVAENPYRKNELFVGRGSELAAIRERLALGRSTLLIGGRRTGKTCLVQRLNDVGRPLVLLDAAGWTIDSEASVLNAIGNGIDRQLRMKSQKGPYTRERLLARLKKIGKIAIVIDEADRILGEPWAGDFLFYLRCLDDTELRSLISFLLIGGPALAEYKNPDDKGSPPLNTADPVFLEPLTSGDVRAMMVGLPASVTVDEVMREAGGHPWLINRLLTELWDGKEFQKAVYDVWDHALRNFYVWRRQVGEKGLALLRIMPDEGLPRSEFFAGKMARHREGLLRCRYTCLVKLGEQGAYLPGPRMFLDWVSDEDGEPRTWDLAISYASEDEDLAKTIYDRLNKKFRIFFAPAEGAYMWGQELDEQLPKTYGVESRFVLVLSSESYVSKHWTKLEFDAALKLSAEGRLMVVNLGKLPPSMPPKVVFLDGNHANMVILIDTIRQKLSPIELR